MTIGFDPDGYMPPGARVVYAEEHEKALARIAELTKQKDGAYSERNQCVALIARMALKLGWLAGTGRHPDLDTAWEDDWRTILFINIPDVGQVSWHFHDSERHLLTGLPEYPTGWDGHSTEEKYRRVNAAFTAPKERQTP